MMPWGEGGREEKGGTFVCSAVVFFLLSTPSLFSQSAKKRERERAHMCRFFCEQEEEEEEGGGRREEEKVVFPMMSWYKNGCSLSLSQLPSHSKNHRRWKSCLSNFNKCILGVSD